MSIKIAKVAALYDIHGNLPALEAVLEEIRRLGVETVVVGGDVVPGPLPLATLAALTALDLDVRFVRGNGETAVEVEAAGLDSGVPPAIRDAARWTAQQLGAELAQLTAWPATVRLRADGVGDVLFCHATPRSETEIFTRETPERDLLAIFEALDVDLVVCGHTHMQFDRRIGAVRVINAGSVGMPFGDPGAYWLLIGGDVELRRTAYDLDRAAARLRASGYPGVDDFVENHVLHCPTERAMLDTLAPVAVRAP